MILLSASRVIKMVMKVKAPWKRSIRNNKLKSACVTREIDREKEEEEEGRRERVKISLETVG